MCAGPFTADSPGRLPSDGPATVAGVDLGPGTVVAGGRAWLTNDPVADVGRVWTQLAANFAETGLWSVMWLDPSMRSIKQVDSRPTVDAATALETAWNELVDLLESDGPAFLTPFDQTFPGLTPLQTHCALNALDRIAANTSHPRIMLDPATRPSDVPHTILWATLEMPAETVSAVLTSWEDRFGAYLTTLAGNGLELVVERPPTSDTDILTWAAELTAFNSDATAMHDSVQNYADYRADHSDIISFIWL